MTLTVKEELIKRSPLRILEKSISGGLGPGPHRRPGQPQGRRQDGLPRPHRRRQAPAGQARHPRLLRQPGRPHHHLVRGHLQGDRQEAEDAGGPRRVRRAHPPPGHHELQAGRHQDRAGPAQPRGHDRPRQLPGRDGHRRRARLRPGRTGGPGRSSRTSPDASASRSGSAPRSRARSRFSTSRASPASSTAHLGVVDVLISLQHHGDHVHFNLVQDHGRLAAKDLRLKLDPTTLLIAKDVRPRAR
ncbi:MAG: hypothetical protein M0C28_07020 [Candidatus Moduliflexus flocculans]|nr:hypothetical protein [Candidatus Moduliflexus flocculans]